MKIANTMVMASAVALTLLLPSQVKGQQGPGPQDPALIAQGFEAWLNTCQRCHVPRPSAERTDREWAVIVTHMRARANLPKSTAEAVLAYLQATNVPETAGGGGE